MGTAGSARSNIENPSRQNDKQFIGREGGDQVGDSRDNLGILAGKQILPSPQGDDQMDFDRSNFGDDGSRSEASDGVEKSSTISASCKRRRSISPRKGISEQLNPTRDHAHGRQSELEPSGDKSHLTISQREAISSAKLESISNCIQESLASNDAITRVSDQSKWSQPGVQRREAGISSDEVVIDDQIMADQIEEYGQERLGVLRQDGGGGIDQSLELNK